MSDSLDSGELLVPEWAIALGKHAKVFNGIEMLTAEGVTPGKLALYSAAAKAEKNATVF